MTKICLRYACIFFLYIKVIFKIFPKCNEDMLKILPYVRPKYALDMPKICCIFTLHMPQICITYAWVKPGICLELSLIYYPNFWSRACLQRNIGLTTPEQQTNKCTKYRFSQALFNLLLDWKGLGILRFGKSKYNLIH